MGMLIWMTTKSFIFFIISSSRGSTTVVFDDLEHHRHRRYRLSDFIATTSSSLSIHRLESSPCLSSFGLETLGDLGRFESSPVGNIIVIVNMGGGIAVRREVFIPRRCRDTVFAIDT